jgi:hypothetical protein
MTDSTRAAFEAWWAEQRALNCGTAIGAVYRHWAFAGWKAARKAALAEAAKVCDEQAAIHIQTSYECGACEKCAEEIRALADGATKEGAGD